MRPVYRNENLPHEEDRNVYCPNLCHRCNDFWNYTCILDKSLDKPKAVEIHCFIKDKDNILTHDEVKEYAEANIPSYMTIEGVAIQDKYIQIYTAERICSMNILRIILDNDFSNIRNLGFDKIDDKSGYYLNFECTDEIQTQLLKDKYKETIDLFTNGEAKIKLKTVYFSNDDDYTFFYFEFRDYEHIKFIRDLEKEFNITLDGNFYENIT